MVWRFTSGATKSGKYSWWLFSGTGEMAAWAGATFTSLALATRAAEEFKAGAPSVWFEPFRDVTGQWRWRAWRSSVKVASSGESFPSQATAERAAAEVKGSSGLAVGP